MKTITGFLFLVLAFNVNAFEKCVNYHGDNEVTVSIEKSETNSFKGCPTSILMRDINVRDLTRIESSTDGKTHCVYGGYGTVIKCTL